MLQDINHSALQLLAWGHNLMAFCALMYLSWWAIFFRPNIQKVTGILYWCGVICIVLAAVSGLVGAVLIGMGTSKASTTASPTGWWFVLGAIVVYFALMFITSKWLGRPVTTELVLFVIWTALELAVLFTLGSDRIGMSAFVGLLITVIAVFVVMLVCYMLYYNLSPVACFIDGAIPLAFVGIYSIMMTIMFSPPSDILLWG